MSTVWLALAWLMAAIHFALIVFLIVGGPLSLRWPQLVRLHAAVAVATGAVFVVGADCPLTTWQKHFLDKAGRPVYDGGFIEHYLVQPVSGGGMTPALKLIVVAVWVAPTFASHLMLWHRRTSESRRAASA